MSEQEARVVGRVKSNRKHPAWTGKAGSTQAHHDSCKELAYCQELRKNPSSLWPDHLQKRPRIHPNTIDELREDTDRETDLVLDRLAREGYPATGSESV